MNIKLSSTNSLISDNHDECGNNVHTTVEGVTGRIFSFLAENAQLCAEWIDLINNAESIAKKNFVPCCKNYQVITFVLSSTLRL
jgi:hypothetical protein